jgi:hypothetical protein
MPARLKEWAYAGFAITLASALIAHFSLGDGPKVWSCAAATGVLWGLSYFFWRRLRGHASERLSVAGADFREDTHLLDCEKQRFVRNYCLDGGTERPQIGRGTMVFLIV